jgi:endonuclease III
VKKSAHDGLVRRLLDVAGTTYADAAGIKLKDTPMPLFQLLTLCMLASKPINADIAVAAARELFAAGLRTPEAAREAERQTMIDAFGRASYARYDESSATRLTEIADALHETYDDDLRRLARAATGDVKAASRLLQQFKGIGETGADIFLREVQDVWTWARPYFDRRVLDTAKDLGLPAGADELSALAPRSNAALAAALVRVSLDDRLRDKVLQSS